MEKIKAACFRSLTMAWSYVLLIVGFALSNLDTAASIVTDAQVSKSIAGLIGTDPVFLGKWTAAIGIITTAARVRGLATKGKA